VDPAATGQAAGHCRGVLADRAGRIWQYRLGLAIPLAITHLLRAAIGRKSRRLVLAGFGVGLSWGAAALEVGPIVPPELEIVP
jgi:hypothetical protein